VGVTGLVEALWVAPFEAQLPDGNRLIPNVTTASIPAGEAQASDHWQPAVKAAAARKPAADASTTDGA